MKRKLFLAVISTILLIGTFSTTAFASNSQASGNEDNSNALKKIADQSESIELIDSDELPKGAPVIEFDNVEEFEKAVADLEKENKEQATENKEINPESDIQPLAAAKKTTVVLDVLVKLSKNPLKQLTQPGTINVDLGYSYTGTGSNKKFSKINSVKSYSTLSLPTSWKQTSYSNSFYSSKKGVKTTINGYNLVGVSIGGFAAGAKVKDKLIFNYKIGQSKKVVKDTY